MFTIIAPKGPCLEHSLYPAAIDLGKIVGCYIVAHTGRLVIDREKDISQGSMTTLCRLITGGGDMNKMKYDRLL
jgi:hypothetical protein